MANQDTGDGEVIATVELRFKPGTVAHVVERLAPLVRETRQEEGNISLDVFQVRSDENVLIVIERWRSQELLERHYGSQNTKDVMALYQDTLETPLGPESAVYLRDITK